MPREFPEPNISDDDRSELRDRSERGLWGDLPDPQTPEDVRRLQDQYGRDNLIQWLSGTTDKRSRAWKSARDGLSRRRSGRVGVGRAWRDKFRSAGRRGRSDRIRSRGTLNVSLTADIRTSRKWDYGRTMTADLSGSELEDYLEAAQDGRYEDAALIVADSYGIDPEYIVEIANVSGFDTDAAELGQEEDEE